MIAAREKPKRHREVVAEFWRDCRPRRLRSLSNWMESDLVIPDGPHEGRKFRFNRQPFSRLLIDQLGHWRRHVITGPSQSGKSLMAFVAPLMYHLFEREDDGICGLPTLDMASVKWKNDILPGIEASRYRDLIPTRGPGSKGGTPTEVQFANGRSLLFMTGGGGDKQRAGATAPVLVVTETDGMDEVGGTSRETDKLRQLEARTRAFGLESRVYLECTVSIEEGRTWQGYTSGTASRIACPCDSCGAWVSPEREDLVGWQSAENKLEAGELARFACPECGVLIDEPRRREMNERAVLIHRGQEMTPDGKIVGECAPTDTLGFRWSGFNNLFTPIEQLGMEEWEAAQSEESEAVELERKQFVWCLPATNENVQKVEISQGIIRGSAKGYHGRCNGREMWEAPAGAERTMVHVDIGQAVLNWAVSCQNGDYRDVIAYGAEETPQPEVIGPEKAITAALTSVADLIESHCDPDIALVDCGNWNEVIYEWVLARGGVWRAAMGLSKYTVKKRTKDCKPSANGDPWYESRQRHAGRSLWVINFDPNTFKTRCHGQWKIRPLKDDGGRSLHSVTLFGDDPAAHAVWAKQMTAEEFVTEFKPGKGTVTTWDKKRGDNHYFDNDVGTLVGLSVLTTISEEPPTQVERVEEQSPFLETPDGRPFFVGDR